jgi:formate dehydrogenase subunit gamma
MRPPADGVARFTVVERWVHRSTSGLVAVLVATGLTLYLEPLAVLVGRRTMVEGAHVVAGLLMALPMLVGLAVSPELRGDVRVLARLTRVDREWLRRRDRRTAALRVGKFNGGQKLAAATMAGAGLVLLGTGLLLLAPVRIDLPDGVREGATVTHDLFTFGVLLLLGGHVWLAARHPEARQALRTGVVDRGYAQREHAGWVEEMTTTSPGRGT